MFTSGNGDAVELRRRVTEEASGVHGPRFFSGCASSRHGSCILQTDSATASVERAPTLCQSVYPGDFSDSVLPGHRESPVLHRGRRDIPQHPVHPIRELGHPVLLVRGDRRIGAALEHVARRIDGLVVEVVAVVTEEAAIEVEPAGVGEAAGDPGPALGVAEEAVGLDQVAVALGEAVHRRGRGREGGVAPPPVGDAHGDLPHDGAKVGDDVPGDDPGGVPAEEARFGDSRVGDGGGEEERGEREQRKSEAGGDRNRRTQWRAPSV